MLFYIRTLRAVVFADCKGGPCIIPDWLTWRQAVPLEVHLPAPLSDNNSPEERAKALIDEDVLALAKAAKAANTLLAYEKSMGAFTAWCRCQGVASVPALPEAVAAYLAARVKGGLKASSLNVVVSAIRHFHHEAGLASPTEHEGVQQVMRGIRRTIGTAGATKEPATAERVAAMLAHVPDTLAGKRDRALILLGMAGAFRRSELVGLEVEDLAFTDKGMDVRIRRSKTDQERQGQFVAIPHGESLRPVLAVRSWLEASGIQDGPLLRSVNKAGNISPRGLTCRSVADIVKRYARCAGFLGEDFSGHSLRAGFVTSAADRGADINRIMDQTRHTDPRTVRKYIRRADRYKDHAGAGFL